MTLQSNDYDINELEWEEFSDISPGSIDFTRRGFMQTLGAGLLITAVAGGVSTKAEAAGGGRTVTARLHIGEDGSITVLTGKVELGQGSRAQISQAAAEELRVDVGTIRLVMADTALTPNDGTTAGSKTTPNTIPAIRNATAAARMMLVETAAKSWGVKPRGLEVRDGVVRQKTSGKSITYADLAKTKELNAAFDGPMPGDVEVTPVKKWRVLGTSVPRPNGRDLVTGTHRYASDIRRPGMLYGKVLRAPAYEATLDSIDLSSAKKMDGVVVVRNGEFVGCVAPTTFLAEKALDAVAKTAKWSTADHPSSETVYDYLKANISTGGGSRRGRSGNREKGSVEDGLKQSADVLSEEYTTAYIQHAPSEPRTATAEWDGDSITIWTGTQAPFRVRDEVAETLNVAEDKVRIIVPDMGCGYGGKHSGETAVEAARLAKAAGKPVKVIWTREEEFTWAYFRPASVIQIEAGIGKNGKLVAWHYTNINSGTSGIDMPYTVPNSKVEYKRADTPMRQGSYRALASPTNNFARESFIDEMAHAADMDPLEFRLANLEKGRLRDALEAVAKRFGWTKKRAPDVGIGIACGTEKGGYVATCVEVHVDRKAGTFKVLRVCETFECGAIMNPANLRAQVEGCIIMGLGGALFEEMRFEDGKILNGRFSSYRVPRFQDVPKLDIVLLDRPDITSAGAGETPIMGVAPAIANAIFDATGIRIRSMPIRTSELHAT